VPRSLLTRPIRTLLRVGVLLVVVGVVTLSRESSVQEVLARVKGLREATSRPAVILDPELPITGAGRSSWGPVDPDAPLPAVRRTSVVAGLAPTE
jgi:hypothetical protein